MKRPTLPKLISAGFLYSALLFLLQYFWGSRKMISLTDYLSFSGACLLAGVFLIGCIHFRGILAKHRIGIRIAVFVLAIAIILSIREVVLRVLGLSRAIDFLSSSVLFALPLSFLFGRTGSSENPPNQAPEPTPTAVTPPAGQEARQP